MPDVLNSPCNLMVRNRVGDWTFAGRYENWNSADYVAKAMLKLDSAYFMICPIKTY